MEIYIDSSFHCHTTNPNNVYRKIETDFFDDKCGAFIEGYCFVPAGEEMKKGNNIYTGQLIAPWKPFDELDQAQRNYEREQLADMQAALEILGVKVDG